MCLLLLVTRTGAQGLGLLPAALLLSAIALGLEHLTNTKEVPDIRRGILKHLGEFVSAAEELPGLVDDVADDPLRLAHIGEAPLEAAGRRTAAT